MKFNKKPLIYKTFFILILLCCFQNLTIWKLPGFSLKPFHLFALIFLLPMSVKKKCVLPNRIIVTFLLYIIFITFINITVWGVSSLIFNYIYCFFLIMIILTFADKFTVDDYLSLLRKTAI